MILKLIDQKVRKAFSDTALQYEALSGLQREIGRELIAKTLNRETADKVLDVGMGTGRLTNRLKLYFPDAQVVGIDVASGMVRAARQKYDQIDIVQADAGHLPFKDGTFDIIVSNLAYHWVSDLTDALTGIHALLKCNGYFRATLFGENTLCELFKTLKRVVLSESEGQAFSMSRLPTVSEVENSLTLSGFGSIKVSSEIIKTHFEDMYSLVRWLKSIGANAFERDFYLGKERLARANELYNRECKDKWGVCASFEVIWIEAETKT